MLWALGSELTPAPPQVLISSVLKSLWAVKIAIMSSAVRNFLCGVGWMLLYPWVAEFTPREIAWFSEDEFYHRFHIRQLLEGSLLSSLVAYQVMVSLQPHQLLDLAHVLAGGRAAGMCLSAVLGASGVHETTAGVEVLLLLTTVRMFMHCCYRWHPKWIVWHWLGLWVRMSFSGTCLGCLKVALSPSPIALVWGIRNPFQPDLSSPRK